MPKADKLYRIPAVTRRQNGACLGVGAAAGRLGAGNLALGAEYGRLGAGLGAWASNSSAATFSGLFQAQINCKPETFIYQIEAPDVSFRMQLESDHLEFCSSRYF
ncbi:hypothetical protein PIB30_057798 [Stylosanthes scabra]|uniref:Uncharacterized protein n=1 Tax=Stylosanthes scabra TaxID=79078 RepID=A0ABU6WN36_9FABA|nr:hypothetical protein [Stylosanthes scabra]